MKSEMELLEEVMANKLKGIIELEAYVNQLSSSAIGGLGSLGVGIETLANAQVQLSRMRVEQSSLEQRYKVLQPADEQTIKQGTKEEILEVLKEMDSDNSVLKLIMMSGNNGSPKES